MWMTGPRDPGATGMRDVGGGVPVGQRVTCGRWDGWGTAGGTGGGSGCTGWGRLGCWGLLGGSAGSDVYPQPVSGKSERKNTGRFEMRDNARWHVVPTTSRSCVIALLAG